MFSLWCSFLSQGWFLPVWHQLSNMKEEAYHFGGVLLDRGLLSEMGLEPKWHSAALCSALWYASCWSGVNPKPHWAALGWTWPKCESKTTQCQECVQLLLPKGQRFRVHLGLRIDSKISFVSTIFYLLYYFISDNNEMLKWMGKSGVF